MAKLPVISLFSGAMGLDLGLEKAGFEVRVAVENDPIAAETIRRNKPTLPIIEKDIRDVSSAEILEAAGLKRNEPTLVAGGPCCQAFSTAGKRGSLSDDRGNLFLHFIRIVKDTQPDFFLIENVKGLLSAAIKHRPLKERTPEHPPLKWEELLGSAFVEVAKTVASIGGITLFDVVNSSELGAPQNRERVILLGSPKSLMPMLPTQRMESLTLRDTIADMLDGHDHQYPQLSPKYHKYMPKIPPGGNWKSLPKDEQCEAIGKGAFESWGGRTGFLRRLAWDKPSPTLVGAPNGRATMMIHPEQDRVLSIQEYKRIQEFPEDWEIHGSLTSQYQQIGNAVPVRMAQTLGEKIIEALNASNVTTSREEKIYTRNPIVYRRLMTKTQTILPPGLRAKHGSEKMQKWLDGMEKDKAAMGKVIGLLGDVDV